MTLFGRRPGDMFKDTYDADEDGVIDDDASHPHTHDDLYVQLENLLHSWCLGDQYKQVIQGNWQYNNSLDYAWYSTFRSAPAAINDEIEYELFAQAGQRTLEILTKTDLPAGIITVYLDDVSQGTIDNYSNPTVKNVKQTLSMTAVTTGKHSLKLKATDKHPSSAGYYIYLGWLRIK